MFQGYIDQDAASPVEATAIPDVLFESGLQTIGPAFVRSVVIGDNYLIFAPIGLERAEIGVTRRRGNYTVSYTHLTLPTILRV